MIHLAVIEVLDHQNRNVTIPVVDFLRAIDEGAGSRIFLRDGTAFVSKSTAAQVATKIDTLWDEWLAAFPA